MGQERKVSIPVFTSVYSFDLPTHLPTFFNPPLKLLYYYLPLNTILLHFFTRISLTLCNS